MNNVEFIDGIPVRGSKYIKFIITEWCILEDCNQPECHNCYPVLNCNKHKKCIKEGICKFIPIPKKKI